MAYYIAQLKPEFPLQGTRGRAGHVFAKGTPQFFSDGELTAEQVAAIEDDMWIHIKEVSEGEFEKFRELAEGKRPDPDVKKPELAPEDDVELGDALAEDQKTTMGPGEEKSPESDDANTEAQEAGKVKKSPEKRPAKASRRSTSVSKAKKSRAKKSRAKKK